MGEASVAPSSVAPPQDPEFPSDQVLKAYQAMVIVRVTDERCLTLQRQGRIGFYVPLQGQEAAQVGCAWALRPEDWLFPAYRELGVALVRGIPLQLVLDQLFGNSGDELKGRQMPNHYGYRRFNFVTASSPVGTQISHAVGAAMAAQRKGDSLATIAFFGDGTTSSNDFHAGLNFAGVFQTPTIFFCQNNQWAISLPREKQTHSKTLAEKALAYGIAGVVVDGTDLRAVYRAVVDARNRAISGGGPTLIEAQVYRLGPHSTSDDPKRYRTDAELAEWRAKDPIARLKKELLESGQLSEAQDAALWDSAKELLSKSIQKSESLPPVAPMSIFDDVFATPTRLLQEERRELEQLFNQGVARP